jgi:hypothetical protein
LAVTDVGMEVISGRYATITGETDLTYGLIYTLEELLEMVGIIILFIQCLGCLYFAYSLQKNLDIKACLLTE